MTESMKHSNNRLTIGTKGKVIAHGKNCGLRGEVIGIEGNRCFFKIGDSKTLFIRYDEILPDRFKS